MINLGLEPSSSESKFSVLSIESVCQILQSALPAAPSDVIFSAHLTPLRPLPSAAKIRSTLIFLNGQNMHPDIPLAGLGVLSCPGDDRDNETTYKVAPTLPHCTLSNS